MAIPAELWQLALLGAAALLILLKAWRGWRLGVVRQLAGIAALVAAWIAGLLGGKLMAPVLKSVWPGPDRLLSIVGGILLALFVFATISLVSALVFKKTEHQSVGLVRFGFGLSGAIVGAAYGIVLVWVLVLGLRLVGTVAETQLAVENNPRLQAGAAQEKRPPGPVIGGMAQVKRALEHGALGTVVEQLDPVPGHYYSTLGKLGRVVGDPRSIERFTQYPGVRPLMQQPKLTALLNDPSVAKAALERNYVALFSHPRIVAAANDPELGAALQKIELEKALDFALTAPGAPAATAPR